MTKNKIKKLSQLLLSTAIFTVLFISSIAITTPTIHAQEKNTETFEVFEILTLPGAKNDENPKFVKEADALGVNPIMAFILTIIDFGIIIIGSFAFLIMIAGSVIIMTAGSNDPRHEQGKNMLTYSIIGLIVAFSAFIISTFVQSLVTGT